MAGRALGAASKLQGSNRSQDRFGAIPFQPRERSTDVTVFLPWKLGIQRCTMADAATETHEVCRSGRLQAVFEMQVFEVFPALWQDVAHARR